MDHFEIGKENISKAGAFVYGCELVAQEDECDLATDRYRIAWRMGS
jgi:hypothetical protein